MKYTKKSRTEFATLNTSIALALQPFQVLLGFINRTIFINLLGVTYLGLNNYLSSLVSILSLAELGVAGAMSYALYGPLDREEHGKINAFMISKNYIESLAFLFLYWVLYFLYFFLI